MSLSGNPTQKSPESAFALQKYLLLHSQHDAVQRHLCSINPDALIGGSAPPSPPSSRKSSLSSSPPKSSTHQHLRSGSTVISPISEISEDFQLTVPSRPVLRTRRSSLPTPPSPSMLAEVEADEQKLLNVNQQIKTTLTDLLNCESVRNDGKYRMWIQTRLMDAERELKGSRSRSCSRRKSVQIGSLVV